MSNDQEIEFQNIDHLGIIAGIIDQYGSVKAMQCLKQQTQEDWLLFQYLCV